MTSVFTGVFLATKQKINLDQESENEDAYVLEIPNEFDEDVDGRSIAFKNDSIHELHEASNLQILQESRVRKAYKSQNLLGLFHLFLLNSC